MQERPRLRTIELTEGRELARKLTLGALPVFAVIAALGYVLPAHRLEHEWVFHSNFSDGGPASLLVLAGVVLCTGLLFRHGRFGAGMGAGVLGMLGAVLALAPVFLVHMFSHVDHSYGESLFAIGELGLFFTGAAVLVVEPIVFLLERRRIVRASMPVELPVARALT